MAVAISEPATERGVPVALSVAFERSVLPSVEDIATYLGELTTVIAIAETRNPSPQNSHRDVLGSDASARAVQSAAAAMRKAQHPGEHGEPRNREGLWRAIGSGPIADELQMRQLHFAVRSRSSFMFRTRW